MSQVLLIPGIGRMTFAGALRLLQPYSPRLAYNFLDPTNSLFQGNTLTPVSAVTNPVGVVIDQTQGGLGNLGAELVTNGDFANGTTGWSPALATQTIVGSELELTATILSSTNRTAQSFSTSIGKMYRLTASSRNGTGTQASVRIGTSAGSFDIFNQTSPGAVSRVFIATTTTTFVSFVGAGNDAIGSTYYFGPVSVREIPGNHATASSDAKRPLWNSFTVNGRTVRGAVLDGADDALTVSGFNLSNTDKVCVIAGVRKIVDQSNAILVEHSSIAGTANIGSFNIHAPRLTDPNYSANLFGASSSLTSEKRVTTFTAPISNHLAVCFDFAKVTPTLGIDILVNNVRPSETVLGTLVGTGPFGNYTLNIGGRNNAASLPFNGAVSYLFICGAIPPDDVLTRVYRGLGPQIGVSV